MEQEFRKKTFRGAKIEDLIFELEKLSLICEEKYKSSEQLERQCFFEGMALAYATIGLKLEPFVINELYNAAGKTFSKDEAHQTEHVKVCFFVKEVEEVGEVAMGPGVSICGECLELGSEVIKSHSLNEYFLWGRVSKS